MESYYANYDSEEEAINSRLYFTDRRQQSDTRNSVANSPIYYAWVSFCCAYDDPYPEFDALYGADTFPDYLWDACHTGYRLTQIAKVYETFKGS